MTDNNTVIALFTAATLALTSPRARAQPRDAPIPPDEPSLALWARLSATNHLWLVRSSYADGSTVGSLFVDSSTVNRLYIFGAQASVLGTYSPAPYLTVFAGPAVERDLFGDAAGPSWQSDVSDRLATVVSFGIGAAARL